MSPKNSFDDDDDKLDWLKISSDHGSKSGKSESTKIAASDDDDDNDDWLGMKSSKKSVSSFSLGDGFDLDLSPDISLTHGQIRGGARTKKETKPSISVPASVTERSEIPSPSSVTKAILETKPSKPVVEAAKEPSSKREIQKVSMHIMSDKVLGRDLLFYKQ